MFHVRGPFFFPELGLQKVSGAPWLYLSAIALSDFGDCGLAVLLFIFFVCFVQFPNPIIVSCLFFRSSFD